MQYNILVDCYEKLEKTSKRLEKTDIIADVLRKTGIEDIDVTLLLLQGKLFPDWDERKIGVAARLIIKAINVSTGVDANKVEDEWKKTGDLGLVAENLISTKKQHTLFSRELTVKKVFENLRKLAELEGSGTVDKKMQLIAELLTSANSKEAKYIVRTILGELRVGVGSGSLRDSIVWAYTDSGVKYDKATNSIVIPENNREKYNQYIGMVQHAYDLINEFSVVVKKLKEHKIEGLGKIEFSPGKPINVMLYQKAKDIADAFETVGKPAALEYKYDGFRLQVHKTEKGILLFTRRLENVTKQFPEVVEYAKNNIKGNSFILDAEAVGFDSKTGKYQPFQNISQRIRRKYDIEKMSKELPVELNIFDIIFYEGKSMINEPFKERRKLLEKIVTQKTKKIVLAKQIITDDLKKAEKFYNESLESGEEGIMVKNLDGIYKPGSRVGYGVKVKPVMESLDLVITGAEWGEGKRSGWLTSFNLSCWDKGKLLEIGKVGTGIKELEGEGVSFLELTRLLKPLITKEKGKEVSVKAKIIIEVDYEEIQRSPTYSSGFALRFPRLVRLRNDKPLNEISSISYIKKLYEQQGRTGREKDK